MRLINSKSRPLRSVGFVLLVHLLAFSSLSWAAEAPEEAQPKKLSIEKDLENLIEVEKVNSGQWDAEKAGLRAASEDEELARSIEEDPALSAGDLSTKSN